MAKNILRKFNRQDPQLQKLLRSAESSPLAVKGALRDQIVGQFAANEAQKQLGMAQFGLEQALEKKQLKEQKRQFDKSLGLRQKELSQSYQDQLAKLGLMQDMFKYKKKQGNWSLIMGIPKLALGFWNAQKQAKRNALEDRLMQAQIKEYESRGLI